MEIYYETKKLYKNNLYFNRQETIHPPTINLNIKNHCLYTLIMYDPDAVGGNKIHWLITNIKNNDTGSLIFKYKPPKPPKNTGNHHYIFCLFQQSNFIQNIYFKKRFMTIHELFKKLNVQMKLIHFKYFLSSF